jgi:hypothetical protein
VIDVGVVKKLAGSAVGLLGVARAVTGHVGWYVRHQITGEPREQER